MTAQAHAVVRPEPAPGSVITWQQRFAPDGAVYTYVAIHIAWRGWFVSDDSETPFSWPDLCTHLIGQAPVWFVTGWAPLP